jgi:hypothetical protein
MDDIQQLARNTFEMSGLNQQEWGMIEPGKVESPVMDQHSSFSLSNEPSAFQFDDHSGSGFQTPPPAASGTLSVTPHELEAMVKAEVGKLLEQMNAQVHERVESELGRYARELIPNLAERILKEEIHKLLANPPL